MLFISSCKTYIYLEIAKSKHYNKLILMLHTCHIPWHQGRGHWITPLTPVSYWAPAPKPKGAPKGFKVGAKNVEKAKKERGNWKWKEKRKKEKDKESVVQGQYIWSAVPLPCFPYLYSHLSLSRTAAPEEQWSVECRRCSIGPFSLPAISILSWGCWPVVSGHGPCCRALGNHLHGGPEPGLL